jgi:chromosome segregation ATPase
MDLSNGSGGIDSSKLIDYFTKDFLKDLGQMAVLRDELAKRQGALSAVEDANNLRSDADAYAKSVKAEADVNLTQAKEANNASKELKKALDAKEADLNKREGQYEKDSAALNKAVEAHKIAVNDAESAVALAQVNLQTRQDQIDADRAALDARIKAFQSKVASLEV